MDLRDPRHPIKTPRLVVVVEALLLITLAVVVSGCGYTLAGKASNIPEDVREVYVEPLENETSRSQVEQILSQAIIDELVTRRQFTVINERDGADAILRGSVLEFSVRPVTFASPMPFCEARSWSSRFGP